MPSALLPLLVAALAAFGAWWLAPPAPAAQESTALAPPPSGSVARAVSLGRHAAAADLVWLRAAQFIGAPQSERVRYAGLEHWVALANDLDPSWERPYFLGSILLATLPGRQATAAEILADAEVRLVPSGCREEPTCPAPDVSDADDVEQRCVPCPALVERGCNWEVPLSRGFVAYFGQLDANTAAGFFCESRRRGGPKYLTRFSARLARTGYTCKQLRHDLVGLAKQVGQGGSEILSGREEQFRVVIGCEQAALKQASQAYRLRTGLWPETVAQLLEERLLDEPPWVPTAGQCWTRPTEGPNFELRPCPTP